MSLLTLLFAGATPPPPPPVLSAAASPTMLQVTGPSFTLTTGFTTVTPSNGVGPYSYAWSIINGGSGVVTALNPTSATSAFRDAGMSPRDTNTSTATCTVTDSTHATASVDVAVTFNNTSSL